MTFSDWIKQEGGAVGVSKKLNVSLRAVQYWCNGRVLPNLETYLKIKRLSKGEVTPEAICAHFKKKNKKREPLKCQVQQ
jgi:DNA-binding transcriptional regulator YdaS (Cro superfamily)